MEWSKKSDDARDKVLRIFENAGQREG